MSTEPGRSSRQSPVRRFFSNPKTGELVIAQWPNVPLAVFLVASIVRRVLDPAGALRTGLAVVAGLSLAGWSIAEIIRGDSPFRRVLGGFVLLTLVAGLLVG